MKALLTILTIISFISCSTDSEQREPQANCNCETVLSATSFTLPNQNTQTVTTVANDCTGAQRQRTLAGLYSIGDKVCN